MAKQTLLAELDAAVESVAAANKRRTWLDTLPPDAKQLFLEARKKFQAGGYQVKRYTLAAVLCEHAEKNGWRVCDQRRMGQWLAQS